MTLEKKGIYVGQTAMLTKKFESKDVVAFAELTQDKNPIHLEKEYAAKTRFGECLVHGFLTASLISAVIGTKLPGPGTVYLSQKIIFKAPVYIGDSVTAKVSVSKIHASKPIVTLITECYKQNQEVVIDGEAVVLIEEV